MNGLHDMGGQQVYGPVKPEENEPVFHEEWEGRALALTLAMGAYGRWNIDRSRFARECLPPLVQVSQSYYARWVAGLVDLMRDHELFDEADPDRFSPDVTTPDRSQIARLLGTGGPSLRDSDRMPAFNLGDRVSTIIQNPQGHTRLPIYARGKTGEVVLYHGTHVFADQSASDRAAPPQPLYSVRFTARELWGKDANAKDTVTLDLWEPHLVSARD